VASAARGLAGAYGCHVPDLDVMQAYCEVATMLSQRWGLSSRTVFQQGSAVALPFADATFALVGTEHAQMNIADKAQCYGAMARVLTPGGRLAFHDIFAGPGGEVSFPAPWAGDPSMSHLITPQAREGLLELLGFRVQHWDDVTQEALAWLRQIVDHVKLQGPPPLGPALL
jgi:ubiquinone/menaquinone biosynthesis C-methylase UbiE